MLSDIWISEGPLYIYNIYIYIYTPNCSDHQAIQIFGLVRVYYIYIYIYIYTPNCSDHHAIQISEGPLYIYIYSQLLRSPGYSDIWISEGLLYTYIYIYTPNCSDHQAIQIFGLVRVYYIHIYSHIYILPKAQITMLSDIWISEGLLYIYILPTAQITRLFRYLD